MNCLQFNEDYVKNINVFSPNKAFTFMKIPFWHVRLFLANYCRNQPKVTI